MANQGFTDYQQVSDALKWLGANSQSKILLQAISIRETENRGLIETVDEYVDRASEGKYDTLDNEYYECEPTVTRLFEKLLEEYQNEFVIMK